MYKLGPVQQKILLTLAGGVALGSCKSPQRYFYILRNLRKDWKRIKQANSHPQRVSHWFDQCDLKRFDRSLKNKKTDKQKDIAC